MSAASLTLWLLYKMDLEEYTGYYCKLKAMSDIIFSPDPSPLARQTVWGVLVTGLCHGFSPFTMSQICVQRISSVPKLSDARK